MEFSPRILGLYGTTVPKSLYEGLTADSVTDGFLSRTLIFDVNDHNPKRRITKIEKIPQNIHETAKWWGEFNPGGGDLHPDPHIIPITSEANAVCEAFIDKEHEEQQAMKGDPLATLWTRTAQNADKLAMLYACSRNHESPVIDAEAARYGYGLAEWLTRRMISAIGENVAENAFHGDMLKLQRIFKRNGNTVDRSALVKAMKMPSRSLDEVIAAMSEQGMMAVEESQTKGRSKTQYKWIG